ncbi:hypothetical protein [Vibrio sp. 1180_3]|uniref:hypothetical protein n=1 Tax=Vibrio sp. 1180_3 TaxID=2528832 RepID=UPI002406164E|nr:hypothetical protein [Vibrio sp. 1180_3]MDF9399155.1 hypothetical protein [Vibrio sp. 1180_3]
MTNINPLDAIFANNLKEEPTSQIKQQNEERKAQKWISDQESLFSNVRRNLAKKPEGVDDSEILKAIGLSSSGTYDFKLKDGRRIACDLLVFTGRTEIEAKTDIHPANGRDQGSLDRVALSDIIETIERDGENTYPGVGAYSENSDKVLVFDSSRRRMACILTESSYRIYVAREPISMRDAKYLADISRLTKNLSDREEGRVLLDIKITNAFETVEQLADHVGEESELVRRKLKAAKIPTPIMELFPDYNSCSVKTYQDIAKLSDQIEKKVKQDIGKFRASKSAGADNDLLRSQYDEKVNHEITIATNKVVLKYKGLESEWLKNSELAMNNKDRLALLKQAIIGRKPKAKVPHKTDILEFANKKMAITKKRSGKAKVYYEFDNQPEHKLEKLEQFIRQLFSEDSDNS